MRFTDAVCYVFLTITIGSSCVGSEKPNDVEETAPDRRIYKREATVLIDNFPFDKIFQKPKMVYRRLSHHRYVQPKTKYGPPKPKHGPKARRSPPKKFRPKANIPKRALQNHKNRPTKPRYGPQQKPYPYSVYRPQKKSPTYTFFSPVSSDFGEPPVYDYRPPRQTYAEPPVDSYGEPIKPVYEDIYPTAPSQPTTDHLDNQDFNYRQNYPAWVNFAPGRNADTAHEYSKKVPVRTKPDAPIYVTPVAIDDYDDVVETEPSKPRQNYYVAKKKKRVFSNSKIVKKPWRLPKRPDGDEEIIVGGQYAEPPARFTQNVQSSAPMYEDDEEFSPRQPFDEVPSATSSPYVNYKNSNMAFSPQNLNDAFGIVEK